jgi:hypothetical protein
MIILGSNEMYGCAHRLVAYVPEQERNLPTRLIIVGVYSQPRNPDAFAIGLDLVET